MNEDNIIIQPGNPTPADDLGKEVNISDRPIQSEEAGEYSATPQVFDFSSDFNISPIKDEPSVPTNNVPFKMPTMMPPAAPPAKTTPINKLENFVEPPAPVAAPKPPAAPQQYREAIDDVDTKKWPFAFGRITPNQPLMGADKASLSQEGSTPKMAPASPPVKTIRSEESATGHGTEAASRQVSSLQRDVSAILPNLKEGQPAGAKLPSAIPVKPLMSQTGDIKSLRTYENDVAEALSHRKSSRASIAIAENMRTTGEERLGNKEADEEIVPQASAEERGINTVDVRTSEPIEARPSHIGRAVLYVMASLIIAGGGAWGAYYLYSQSSLAVSEQPAQSTQASLSKSIVPSDLQTKIAIDGKNAKTLYQLINSEFDTQQSPNTLKDLALTSVASGAMKRASFDEAAGALSISVPDMIQRTLTSDWMLGVYADVGGIKHPFIVAKTNLFQNAFAGMLEWEKTMPKDFKPYSNDTLPTDGSGRFIDEIVKNKDVRAYVAGPEQSTLFLYSFINNSLIVLADNEIALAEIITRLENQAYVR